MEKNWKKEARELIANNMTIIIEQLAMGKSNSDILIKNRDDILQFIAKEIIKAKLEERKYIFNNFSNVMEEEYGERGERYIYNEAFEKGYKKAMEENTIPDIG